MMSLVKPYEGKPFDPFASANELKIGGEKDSEREGFEPSVEFPLHTLSKRAPSTTRTSLRLESITYRFCIRARK